MSNENGERPRRVLYTIEQIRAIRLNHAKCTFNLSMARAAARNHKPEKLTATEYPHWLAGQVAEEYEAFLVSRVEEETMKDYLKFFSPYGNELNDPDGFTFELED